MLLIASQYFDILETYINNFAINQALANPRKSQELTEFVQDIVHNETSLLMREHNDIIQTQRDLITSQNTEMERLQRERMDRINSHAAEVHGLLIAHAAEVQSLCGTHAAEVQDLHREYTDKLRTALHV